LNECLARLVLSSLRLTRTQIAVYEEMKISKSDPTHHVFLHTRRMKELEIRGLWTVPFFDRLWLLLSGGFGITELESIDCLQGTWSFLHDSHLFLGHLVNIALEDTQYHPDQIPEAIQKISDKSSPKGSLQSDETMVTKKDMILARPIPTGFPVPGMQNVPFPDGNYFVPVPYILFSSVSW